MRLLLRGLLYVIYLLRALMRRGSIWYWLMPPERRLHELTRNLVWSWGRFRKVLITLTSNGTLQYIPAIHRPNYVYLDGLERTFHELRKLSRERDGRETARAVFVDCQHHCLVISGKTNVGTHQSTSINITPQPGREAAQIPILTIHVHPDTESARGLSEVDYVTFLVNPSQMAMIMLWQGGILFALKTSATAKHIEQETAERWVTTLSREFLKQPWSGLNWQQSIMAFNKAVCTEFGLTLYEAPTRSGLVARRIDVTR